MLKKHHSLYLIPLLGMALLSSLAQAATDCSLVTEIPSSECQALIALYNSTDGDNWTNNTGWNVTNTPCSWEGITCNDEGHVTKIELQRNQLSGSLPAEIGTLTHLQWLYLYNNQLSGSIPAALGNLNRLETLSLCMATNSAVLFPLHWGT